MSITASSLIALVEAKGAKETVGQLLEVGAASDTAGAKLKSMATGGLLVAGAAAVGFGVASVKMAGDFQQSTSTLITSAGLSRDSIGAVRQGILDLSVSTATSTDQLTKGMFNVQSALHLGAGGLQVLKAAAEGARAENSDLAQTTDVLTTAMVNYHLSAAQAVPTMDSLIVTVADGKMHMDDLTGSLKNVLPVSAAFHIQLGDVEGALATMANAGDRGTSAGTHLAMMFKMLSSPTSGAASEMKAMGINSLKLAETMRISLPDALKMIQDAVSRHFTPGSVEYNRAIMAILGGSKSGIAGLELFGQGLKVLGSNTDDAAAALRKGSKDVENWGVIQGNFNFKMDAAKNAVEALMISVGEKLLPVVGQLADAVTPLINDFSTWIGSLSQFGDEVAKATAPVKQIQDYLAPLPDAFDRGTGAIHTISNALTPLTDSFDHAKSVISATTVVTKPLVDSFDRANGIIPKTTTFITKTKEAVSPLVALFLQWRPVLQETLSMVETLAGDVATFATGIADAANQSGAFQSALQFIHDILPDVDTFLMAVGSDINQDVLPPLESLTTNVGETIKNFSTWLDKSGTAKSAIYDLGTAVGITAKVLGTLVGWTAQLVGFLNKDTPAATIFKGAIVALGLAFVGLKLADTVSGFQQMVSKLSDGEGIVSHLAGSIKDKLGKSIDDLLSKQFPNLKKGFDDIKNKAGDTAAAEEKVGTTAEGDMASGVEKGSAASETQLGNVEAQANASAGSVEGIGTAADSAEAQVAVDAPLMDAELTGVKTAADGTSAGVAKVGDNAGTATPQVGGLGGALWNVVGALMSIGLMEQLNIWGNVIAGNYDNKVPKNYGAGGSGKGFGGPHGFASGTDYAPGGMAWVGERGPELVNLPRGSQVISHDLSMGMMSGSGSAIHNHIHVYLDGNELAPVIGEHMARQTRLRYGSRRY